MTSEVVIVRTEIQPALNKIADLTPDVVEKLRTYFIELDHPLAQSGVPKSSYWTHPGRKWFLRRASPTYGNDIKPYADILLNRSSTEIDFKRALQSLLMDTYGTSQYVRLYEKIQFDAKDEKIPLDWPELDEMEGNDRISRYRRYVYDPTTLKYSNIQQGGRRSRNRKSRKPCKTRRYRV